MGVLGLAPFLQKAWFVFLTHSIKWLALDINAFTSPNVFKILPKRFGELSGKTVVLYVTSK